MGELINSGILTMVTFAPAIGAVLLLFFGRGSVKAIRGFALAVTLVTFVLSLHLISHFDSGSSDFQFVVNVPWIPSIGIDYSMGVDGVSVFLILLATLLTPLAVLASWSVTNRAKEYFIFMLLLETGMVGVFVSLDLFLFYLFWEVMLVPYVLPDRRLGWRAAHLRRDEVRPVYDDWRRPDAGRHSGAVLHAR
jgi:NADH-quinone oxidoreductase subunit M